MVFVNHYEHSLDSKNRVVLPAKFRHGLGERVYLVHQGNSLAVFSETEFEKSIERLLAQVRAGELDPMARIAYATSAVEADVDGAGRITIPARLREKVDLTGDVIISGALTYVQIWNPAAFENVQVEAAEIHEQFKAGGTIT